MLPFGDLLSTQPPVRISFEIPTDEAIDMMCKALDEAIHGSESHSDPAMFRSFAIVSGMHGSCRVYADQPFHESEPMHVKLTPMGLALEFLTELNLEARFPPYPLPHARGSLWHRCYEVRPIVLGDHPAAFVLANWMESP